jgi:uncharacterized protein
MNTNKINNKKDILLLFLYSPGVSDMLNEPIKGRTRLIKLLFIFYKEGLKHFKSNSEINENNFYNFFPWNFGPFSQQVYDDLTFFQLSNFIDLQSISSDSEGISYEEFNYWTESTGINYGSEYSSEDDFVEQSIKLTEKGMEYVSKLYNTLTDFQKSLLKSLKAKFNSTPLRAILRYVYQTYPEFASNSTIKENILGKKYDR